MSFLSDNDSKKDYSITGKYNIEKELFSKSANDSPDIQESTFSHDPSFETQVAGHSGKPAGLTGTEASRIIEKYATGDFHGNMFDMYFVHASKANGIQSIFSDLFSGSEIENTYEDLLQYASLVTNYDSLCVRCSGISLPGYEIETKQFTHSGRIVQARTNRVTAARNGSVSFRLDKNLVLMDLFSFMSGNNINYDMSRAQRVSANKDFTSLSALDKAHYVGSFCNIWQHWGKDSDKSYDISELGLCIVVVIRPPKHKVYSDHGKTQFDRLNIQAMTKDGGDHRYSGMNNAQVPYEEKYPVFIFENVKILGTGEVALTAGKDSGEPPEISVDFIFRRFRKIFMTETELENGGNDYLKFTKNELGTPIKGKTLYGYQVPNYVGNLELLGK
jgi:hypothetical protein